MSLIRKMIGKGSRARALVDWLRLWHFRLRRKKWFYAIWTSLLGLLTFLIIINANNILASILPEDSRLLGLFSPQLLKSAAMAFGVWYLLFVILRPIAREARWFTILWSTGIAVLTGIMLGKMILTQDLQQVLTTALAIPVAALVIAMPEYGAIGLFILLCSIIKSSILPAIPGTGIAMSEIMIFIMTVAAIAKRYSKRDPLSIPKTSPMMIPMLAFMFSVVLAISITYYDYLAHPEGPYPFKDIYNVARPLFHYLFFFVTFYAITSEKKLKLLINAALIISAIVSVMMLAQMVAGPKVKLFMGDTVVTQTSDTADENEGGGAELTRTYATGMSLMMIMLPFAFFMTGTAKKTRVYQVLTAIISMGMVFSYARNCWLSCILAMFVVWLAANSKAKMKLAVNGIIGFTISIALCLAFGNAVAGGKFMNSLQKRVETTIHPVTSTNSSLGNRLAENRFVWTQIREHYLLGVGPKPGALGYHKIFTGTRGCIYLPKWSIHNGYLELLLVYGLSGALSVLALSAVFLYRSLKLYLKSKNAYFKAVSISFFAAYIAFIVIRAMVTMALLHELENILATSFMWGCVEAMWHLELQHEAKNRVASALQRI